MHLLTNILLLVAIFGYGFGLECIQCGNNEAWYSEEEHERRIEACRHGLISPTPCTNSSHTHCIVNWFRTGGSSEKVVNKRQCGTESDITGCTLYNSIISRKVRRHLFNRDDSSNALRKESVASYVEVCSTSCPFGECVNSSPNSFKIFTIFAFVLIISLFSSH